MQVYRQLNIRQVDHTGCHKVTMTAPCVVHKFKVFPPIDILKRPEVTSGSMLTEVCSLA